MTASLEKSMPSKPVEKTAEKTAKEFLHPLQPLSAEEVVMAVTLLRQEKSLGDRVRFITITLNEPTKAVVLNFSPGDLISREAFIILLDNETGQVYEAIVSLTQQKISAWKHIPDVQPSITIDEFLECEAAVKANPDFQAALQKRGITSPDLIMVDPWSAGYFNTDVDGKGKRLSRALCWSKSSFHDNGYAHPIEGLVVIFDLNKMEIVQIEDHGVVPVPPQSGNYAQEFVQNYRTDLKPLEIVQPEGASFEVQGHEIRWQKWQMRIGFNAREGLILYTVGYEDKGQVRPILYRASLAEMTVPYCDPNIPHCHKNAFDVGEYGIGMLANSLKLGCDCLGEIHYFDAVLANSQGDAYVIENAICLHEEDYGILWKHWDWRTNETEVRRSRRLVLSFIATVGNYEYGCFWYFYQDGTIQFEVKLTGILSTGALMPGEERSKYGALVAPQLYAPTHQHFFNIRLDMNIDGQNNSVYEVNTKAEPMGDTNPWGNACYAESTLLKTESEAQRIVDPFAGRYWKIVNPAVINPQVGQPVGYKIVPGENILPFAHPESSLIKRSGYITKHLWVTPYHPEEHYPAGNYPNQHPGGDGLPAWTQADRSVENTDLVVWYTCGHHHIPRAEDWPVMPTSYIGFSLKPINFFDASPAIDVPPSPNKHHCHS